MGTPRISRRTVLKGLLGGAVVTVGLPPLELFFNANGTAYAAGGGLPTRFGLFAWGNGMLPDRWIPAQQGTDWELSEQLAPLAPVKHKLTVVTGTRIYVPNELPHHSGAAGIFSGLPSVGGESNYTFGGPSLDQVVANAIGTTTRFKSLELGAQPGSGYSYNGPNSLNPPESSPHKLFERLFGVGFTLPGDEPIIDPTVALRRSVLDAVTEDAKRLQTRLGAADQQRLEQHLTGIRQLEQRLALLEADPPDLAACALPAEPLPEYPDLEGRAQLMEKARAFHEIVAMALACDQTRVFSEFHTAAVSNVLFPGATMGHHQLTHDELGGQPEVHAITVQIIEAMSHLLQTLDGVEEGDGTLLDHCLVLGTSEVSQGRTHSLEEFPLVLAGGASGALRTGLHYRSETQENANKVTLSCLRALVPTVGSWGADASLATDGLGAIEV